MQDKLAVEIGDEMKIQHPLINPESKHYERDGKSAIEELEEQLTISEMIGACKFNIFKYEYRQDVKGQKESDLKKIETYKNYLAFLELIQEKFIARDGWPVKVCYELNEIEVIYKAVQDE